MEPVKPYVTFNKCFGCASTHTRCHQSLDIDYTVGVATGVPTTFYSDGDPSVFGFIDMANTLIGLDEPPLVLSTSYGFDESTFAFDQEIAK